MSWVCSANGMRDVSKTITGFLPAFCGWIGKYTVNKKTAALIISAIIPSVMDCKTEDVEGWYF